MSLIGEMAPSGNLKPPTFISGLHNFLPPPESERRPVLSGVSGGVVDERGVKENYRGHAPLHPQPPPVSPHRNTGLLSLPVTLLIRHLLFTHRLPPTTEGRAGGQQRLACTWALLGRRGPGGQVRQQRARASIVRAF